MKFAAGPPHRWVIELRSGGVMELAADLYSEEDGHLNFCILAEATAGEQAEIHVLSRAPSDSENVLVLVARIPADAVASLYGGEPWGSVQQKSTATDGTAVDQTNASHHA